MNSLFVVPETNKKTPTAAIKQPQRMLVVSLPRTSMAETGREMDFGAWGIRTFRGSSLVHLCRPHAHGSIDQIAEG